MEAGNSPFLQDFNTLVCLVTLTRKTVIVHNVQTTGRQLLHCQQALSGKPLAMKYDGENAVVTVAQLEHLPTQVWVVTDHQDGKTQSVSPRSAPNLQIGMGDGVAYVWTIGEHKGIYTVQDGGLTVFRGLYKTIDGESVSFSAGTGDEKQNWTLIPPGSGDK